MTAFLFFSTSFAINAVLTGLVAGWIGLSKPQWALSRRLVTSHAVLLCLTFAMVPLAVLFPSEPMYSDVYFPYLVVPGFHLYWPARLLTDPLTSSILDLLGPFWGSMVGIFVLPGLFGLIVGGLQWYVVGRLIERYIR